MTANEVISNEEMDALLEGVSSGKVKAGEGPPPPAELKPFDIDALEHIVRGRLPVLEMINERFARQFQLRLFDLLRRPVKLTATGVRTLRLSQYLESLSSPMSLNIIKAEPLPETGLVAIDPSLVFALVDSFFGGTGRFARESEERDFTPAELRIIKVFLGHAFADLEEAWMPIVQLEFKVVDEETEPKFVSIASPSDGVLVSTFELELEDGSGELQITLPDNMLAPIRKLLDAGVQSDREEKQERWSKALREEVEDAQVELYTTLAETDISLRDLIKLKAGDVIPIDIPHTITLRAGDAPIFRAKFGVSRGYNAVKMIERIEPLTIQNISVRKTNE